MNTRECVIILLQKIDWIFYLSYFWIPSFEGMTLFFSCHSSASGLPAVQAGNPDFSFIAGDVARSPDSILSGHRPLFFNVLF
ncbi:MAG TPA: hypothetical protein VMU30_07685 [Bacteroidota bacterium]|nr:hypothetical protein [Bacteroidota bacterium]